MSEMILGMGKADARAEEAISIQQKPLSNVTYPCRKAAQAAHSGGRQIDFMPLSMHVNAVDDH